MDEYLFEKLLKAAREGVSVGLTPMEVNQVAAVLVLADLRAMSDLHLQTLAERFCATPLPDSVCADPCASIHGYPNRTGTNLLSVIEAKQVLKRVLNR